MEKPMNEKNEWDHRISAGVKKDQQIASGSMKLLQHWKRWKDKAPGLSGLVGEIIQATGDIGTQCILD